MCDVWELIKTCSKVGCESNFHSQTELAADTHNHIAMFPSTCHHYYTLCRIESDSLGSRLSEI